MPQDYRTRQQVSRHHQRSGDREHAAEELLAVPSTARCPADGSRHFAAGQDQAEEDESRLHPCGSGWHDTGPSRSAQGSDGHPQVAFLLVAKHLLERSLWRRRPVWPTKAAAKSKKPKAKIPAGTVFQFKITLQGIEPPIWRRIQTKDCTLDKLHEHIQTAMGWTNSHLHQFMIGGVRHGDPELIYEGWEDETPPVNSRRHEAQQDRPQGRQAVLSSTTNTILATAGNMRSSLRDSCPPRRESVTRCA